VRALEYISSPYSTVTSWGKDNELEAFKNMLERFPNGLVAVVSDSYDVWHACEKYWGNELKDLVMKRGENGGCLVVRPDSGDPPEVVVKVSDICGHRSYSIEPTLSATSDMWPLFCFCCLCNVITLLFLSPL